MAEAPAYSDIRISRVAAKLDRIATATMPEYFEPDGRLKDITTLPDRLAEAIREVEFGDDGRPKRIRLHDKLAALGVVEAPRRPPSERGVELNNNQVNIITDEQRIAAVMSLFARVRAGCAHAAGPSRRGRGR
jgi:hypothetical protein